MNPITHLLIGWGVASCAPQLHRRDRNIVALASVAPDLDGFGIVAELLTRDSARPLLWWTEYHRTLGHNVGFALLVTFVAALFSQRRMTTALLATASFHLHLLGDLVGSRGPDDYIWPVPYLLPFSSSGEWVWSGQWKLNAWPNIAITVVLLIVTFILAWRRGYSPVGIFSQRADAAFVGALRHRFGSPGGAA